MKRIHLKRKRKHHKLNILFILLILIVISSIYMVHSISKKVTPYINELASVKINKYSLAIINNAISKALEKDISFDNLFINTSSSDGTLEMIDFNPKVVSDILAVSSQAALNDLKLLESGDIELIDFNNYAFSEEEKINLKKGIIAFVPIGSATGVTLLANLGPKIPVRLHYIGDVNSNITTKITSYGINNALLEVGIHIEVNAQIVLPFSTSTKKISNDMPITIKMVQGKIPSFYSGNSGNSNIYTLPIE